MPFAPMTVTILHPVIKVLLNSFHSGAECVSLSSELLVKKAMLGWIEHQGAVPMDRVATDCADLSYSSQAPVFVVANSDRALGAALRTVEASGHRSAVANSLEDAPVRIEQQAAASALWLEIDCDPGPGFAPLVDQICSDVERGRYGAVISTTAELIDPMFSAFGSTNAHILIDADESERAAALALAANALDGAARLSDVASDNSSVRLRQLSDEVNRIAATLARLSATPPVGPAAAEVPQAGEPPAVSADAVRTIIRARRLRSRYFAGDLFADPAWDMLLDLLQAEIAQLRVPVSSLCIAAAVPATTALRWLKTMVDQGLFLRRADPHDGRRVFVELAPDTSTALRHYFAEVGRIALI